MSPTRAPAIEAPSRALTASSSPHMDSIGHGSLSKLDGIGQKSSEYGDNLAGLRTALQNCAGVGIGLATSDSTFGCKFYSLA
jgi:hypothetical protein